MKKTAGLTALALVTALLLTSCKYRLRIEKVEDDTTAEPTVEVTTETPETEEYTTLDPLTEAGVVYDSASFRAVAMDKAAVLALYTTAMNNVKNRCPGFTKKDYQSIGDVTAGNGRLQLANRILNLVATEVLQSRTSRWSTASRCTAKAWAARLKIRRSSPPPSVIRTVRATRS